MKEINRATIHRLNKEKLHMLTTHIGKQVNIFGFCKFCKLLFDFSIQFFMDFLYFANFYFVSCNMLKAVKGQSLIQVTSRGVLPQASFRLTAVGWG